MNTPTRSTLNKAVAQLAQKLGLSLSSPEAVDLIDDPDSHKKGILRLVWHFNNGESPVGSLTLCRWFRDGGYFKGTVALVFLPSELEHKDVYETLVNSYDYPTEGPTTARETKKKFLLWVQSFSPSSVSNPS